MSRRRVSAAPIAAGAAVVFGLVQLAGCSKHLVVAPNENQRPTVRISSGPIDTTEVCLPSPGLNCYSIMLHWIGYDPDGNIDYFAYAIDPPDAGDTSWVHTTEKEKRFSFTGDAQSRRPDSLSLLRGFHVIVVKAVDDHGLASEPSFRAFYAWTTAPTAQITNPRPRASPWLLPPSVRFKWDGVDADAISGVKRPVSYKYLLLGPGNESVVPGGIAAVIASKGAAIRLTQAPSFPAANGWVAVSGDTTSVQFKDLVPGASYVFVVAAFDDAGAYSPVFQLTTNVLLFTVGFAAAIGPSMAIFNDTFYYKYSAPGFNPSIEVRIEAPADQPITFSWLGVPPPGADIVAYRWMLDGDVFDDRERTDERTDVRHWSAPNASLTSATVGPFAPGEHYFYAQCEDNTGLVALATVHFTVVGAAFDKDLLIVDDTRRAPDNYFQSGGLQPPTLPYPSASELDTLLYAVGGVQWAGAPVGTLSPPGILAGFDYDTLGTRTASPTGDLSLATLAHYRHIVWLVDYDSAHNSHPVNSPLDPMTMLTYMTSPGHLNALAAYARLGGEVWTVGGGAAYAATYQYNVVSNDTRFDAALFSASAGELVAGRFAYDMMHWRREIRVMTNLQIGAVTPAVVRVLGRFSAQPGVYADVPAKLELKTTSSDPVVPPLRSTSQFYLHSFAGELISQPTNVLEAVSGGLSQDGTLEDFDRGRVADWSSSDSLNTSVAFAGVPAGTAGAALRMMRVTTEGGGASDGDAVLGAFLVPVDLSGTSALRLAVREDAAAPATWTLRMFDRNGRSRTAPLPHTGTPGVFGDVDVPRETWVDDDLQAPPFDDLHVTGIALVLGHADAPATTEFDAIRARSDALAPVLDTLLVINTKIVTVVAQGPTMTVYHGHDLPRPYINTGFPPWIFKRAQCEALFDFVLRRLWGLPRRTAAANAALERRIAASHAGRAPVAAPGMRSAPAPAPRRGRAGVSG